MVNRADHKPYKKSAQTPTAMRRMTAIRERLELLQWEMSEIFGVTTQCVYMWEKRGYPRYPALVMDLLDQTSGTVGAKRAKEIFLSGKDAGDLGLVTALVRAVQLRE